jgi:hypothetical protein
MKVFLIIFTILFIINFIFWGILFFNKKNFTNKKNYLLFTYIYGNSCTAKFNNVTKYCTNENFNGVFYIILDWVNGPKQMVATYYVTSSTLHNIRTQNYWLTVFDKKKKFTVGAIRWSNILIIDKNKDSIKTSTEFEKSQISAASGSLQSFQNQYVLVDYRNNLRKLHIYSKGSFDDSAFDEWQKNFET